MKKTRVFSILLALILLLSVAPAGSVFAASSLSTSDNSTQTGNSTGSSSESTVVAAYIVRNGKLTPISISQYQAEIAKGNSQEEQAIARSESLSRVASATSPNSNLSVVTPSIYMYPKYGYAQLGKIMQITKPSLTKRVSNIVYNQATSTSYILLACSVTQSYTANISLSASYKSAITAAIGASWSYSYTTSQTINGAVDGHKYGWIEFTPIMDNSYGYMHYYSQWDGMKYTSDTTTWVDIYTARCVSGTTFPDGIYTVRSSATSPV